VTGTENPSSPSAANPPSPFRLAYVPGVTPGKWVRVWSERVRDVPLELATVSVGEAEVALREGTADASLLRLPIDRTGLSAIPLYAETSVVVVPKEHEAAAVEELTVADLADYVVLHPLDDCLAWESLPGRPAIERPATTEDAIDLVAAGVGLLVVPQSLARLHHRRDLTYRTISDAPQSQVALSWPQEQTTDLMEEFIGIVRGRTANSSRGRAQAQAQASAAKTTKAAKTAKPAKQQKSSKQQNPRGQARRGKR
jgi:DNA-binding transcriptional LysR family regulator